MVTPVRRCPKVKKTAATKQKAMKTSKPLTTGNLQSAIALRQYTDTMRKISGYLDKRKGLAPKVWHMLESGMMEEEDLVPDDRVPPSVNKVVRLLSLDNLKMLATKLHEVRLLREAMYKHFLQIKTKTDAVKVFCFWMRTLDTSALPSKQLSALLEWTVGQARASGVLLEKTVMVPNSKQGRHAGILGTSTALVFLHMLSSMSLLAATQRCSTTIVGSALIWKKFIQKKAGPFLIIGMGGLLR